jgi:hypothetical protein
MGMNDEHADLAGYVAGELPPREAQAVEAHLATCVECRTEVESLNEMREFLGALPPEALLEGPPEGGDLLLQRTLRQVRSEARSSVGRSRFVAVAAAVVVVAAALGGGVLVGRSGSSGAAPEAGAGQQPPAPATSSAVPGTKVVTGSGPGARLTASIVPAAGWVRVEASVTGIPAGQKCRLVVVGKNGDREIAGGWLVSEKASREGAKLYGSALVAPADVASVVVENTDGHEFVQANA